MREERRCTWGSFEVWKPKIYVPSRQQATCCRQLHASSANPRGTTSYMWATIQMGYAVDVDGLNVMFLFDVPHHDVDIHRSPAR